LAKGTPRSIDSQGIEGEKRPADVIGNAAHGSKADTDKPSIGMFMSSRPKWQIAFRAECLALRALVMRGELVFEKEMRTLEKAD
jgi:hypothetical protein